MYVRVLSTAIAVLLFSFAWQAAANDSLPLAGTHFGNPSFGGGAANRLFAYQASYRFRAPRDGTVTEVSFQNRRQSNSQIQERCNAGDKKNCDCVNNGLDEYTCGYIGVESVQSRQWRPCRSSRCGRTMAGTRATPFWRRP